MATGQRLWLTMEAQELNNKLLASKKEGKVAFIRKMKKREGKFKFINTY
jgi:hypothetical protein